MQLVWPTSGVGGLRQGAHQMQCVGEGMARCRARPNDRDGQVFRKLLASRGSDCSSLGCWETSCSGNCLASLPRKSTPVPGTTFFGHVARGGGQARPCYLSDLCLICCFSYQGNPQRGAAEAAVWWSSDALLWSHVKSNYFFSFFFKKFKSWVFELIGEGEGLEEWSKKALWGMWGSQNRTEGADLWQAEVSCLFLNPVGWVIDSGGWLLWSFWLSCPSHSTVFWYGRAGLFQLL